MGPILMGPIALLISFSLAAFATSQDFPNAVEQMKKGNFAISEKILERLTREDPENGLYWFNLGSVYYNLQRYEQALTAFHKVISLGSRLTPAAKFSMGKTYRKLGELTQARDILRELEHDSSASALHPFLPEERKQLALSSLQRGMTQWRAGDTGPASRSFRDVIGLNQSGETSEYARFFLEQLNTRTGTSPYWLFADIGAGYNSNVFLDGGSEAPVGKFATQTFLGAGVQWRSTSAWLARVSYSLYWEETPGAASGRFLSQTLRLPLGWEDARWTLQVAPLLQYQILETDPFLFRAGTSLKLKARRDWGAVGLSYDWARQYAQSSGASYLNGHTHALVVTGLKSWSSFEAEGGWSFSVDDIGDLVATDATLPLAGSAHGPMLRGTWYAGPWEAEIAGSYLWRRFRHPAEPGSLERGETQARVVTRVSRQVLPSLRAFVSGNFLWNKSTLDSASGIDDKNYFQLITLLGASWEILN